MQAALHGRKREIGFTMIFEQTRCELPSQNRTARRRAVVESIIRIFQEKFPILDFRILDGVSAINAQASIINDVRSVDLFAGFAYHPEVGRDALIFVLLHETGHHLSQGCRLPWMPKLACDCAADFWAITEGRAELRRSSCRFVVESALRQIERAANLNGSNIATSVGRARCSFLNWTKRKRRLINAQCYVGDTCAII
jgi:hypothetical protein